MFSLIQAAGWPIWPLILCSVLALALIIERFVSLRTSKVAPTELLAEVVELTRSGLPDSKTIAHLESNSTLGALLAAGLKTMLHQPQSTPEDLRAELEISGRRLTQQLERNLTALATIASVAPLIGLLGTVVGMIEIFSAQSASTANAGGNPVALAHGISVALYNTAFGLMIAIPALVFWRYFRSKVDAHLLTLELSSERFVRHLSNSGIVRTTHLS